MPRGDGREIGAGAGDEGDAVGQGVAGADHLLTEVPDAAYAATVLAARAGRHALGRVDRCRPRSA